MDKRLLILALVLVAAVVASGCRRRHEPVDEVRAAAAPDLGCPLGGVDAITDGAGMWTAFGCGRRAQYVCGRTYCTRHGDVEPDDAP